MNDNVEIIRSNKGGMKIIHRGYMYTVHKKRQGGGIRWRCTQRSLHCKGSISTGNGPPSVNMPHNHIPDPHSVALARCRQLEEFPDITSLLETEYDEIKGNTELSVLDPETLKERYICEDHFDISSYKPGSQNRLFNDVVPIPCLIDSMPLQQRMLLTTPPQVQIPSSEAQLQSQPLSPTKLKVTRQINKPQTVTPKVVEAPSEEVCLRWNSHHSNMQTTFPQLLEKEQYVDVTVIAEGKTLKCHRMILSSCSSYFEEILNGITPLQHPVIILKGIPFWILKALIDFMYVGEVNIDQNKLPELLDVAELLKVKGLAGKSNNTDKSDKQENQPSKKQQPKDNSPQQQIIAQPQFSPVTTKVEELPLSDPLELLEPKFPEDGDATCKIKENKLSTKKNFTRKFRKRKSSEDEITPPLFPMRRGTRSRPNVKIPKYYDYEDIVKPTVTDIQPFSPVVNIKSEPVEVEETDIAYNEIADVELENTAVKHSFLSNVGVNPKPSENSSSAKEYTVCTRSRSVSRDTEERPLPYRIKVKRFSSLSESTTCKMPDDDINILEKSSTNDVSVDKDPPDPVISSDNGEMHDTCVNEIETVVMQTNSTEVINEHTAQNDASNDADPLKEEEKKTEICLIETSNIVAD